MNRVPHNRISEQPLQQHSPFVELPRAELRRLLCESATMGTERLFYIVLLEHADCSGNVFGRIAELARVANTTDELARRVMRRLRYGGHIILVNRGRKGHPSRWRLSAIPDTTPRKVA